MKNICLSICCVAAIACDAAAEGVVAKVVSSPLSASGTVKGAHTGLNVYLQSDEAQGDRFMDPAIPGYGFPAGGHVEIEMGDGFERIADVPIEQPAIMVVAGAPQQGLPGSAVGYSVSEGGNPMTIRLTPVDSAGIPVEKMRPPAPGAKNDAVPNRGAKVFHVGLTRSAFRNAGDEGTVHVRFVEADGTVSYEGTGTIAFLDEPEPQIFPNNFPDANQNHNWQRVNPGQTLGKSEGTVPLVFAAYQVPEGVPKAELVKALDGRTGVGLVSSSQLKEMEFNIPSGLAGFEAGLLIEDTNGDMRLDPMVDAIIGGATVAAPEGATGMDFRSLTVHGAHDLSKPISAYNARFGPIFGGAVGLLQFTVGDKPGVYLPTIALLRDPSDPAAGESASYAYTVVVE